MLGFLSRSLPLCLALAFVPACGDDTPAETDATDDSSSTDSETTDAPETSETSDDSSTITDDGSTTDEDDTTDAMTTEGPLDCDPVPDEAQVQGYVYVDTNNNDQSTYVGGYEDGTDTPIAGAQLTLFSSTGTQAATTCEDGRYGFAGLSDGVHLVAAEPSEQPCTQRNCTKQLPVAIESGQVTMLTIGDSVPVLGDAFTFPGRVANLLGELAEVEDRNEAVSGSKSTEWIPGTSYFEQRVRPNLADTDLVVISVGGNDVLELISSVDLGNIIQVLAEAEILVADIAENVRTIKTEIHAENPDVDVVYCIYVDYSLATETSPWDLTEFLPAGTIHDLLVQARELVEADDELIVVDLLEASQTLPMALDDYLADALHFNDAGHTLYAEEVFKALGGVLLGPSPLSGAPITPLGTEHSYGYSP